MKPGHFLALALSLSACWPLGATQIYIDFGMNPSPAGAVSWNTINTIENSNLPLID